MSKYQKIRITGWPGTQYIFVTTQPPLLSAYAGLTAPSVITRRRNLGDSLAHTVSFEDAYFSQLEAMNSVNFAFRTQGAETKAQVLERLD